jgi:hypothetical protein
MKRTVLYYPTISIPSGKWLRLVLFYFDEVASIVPRKILFSANGEYEYGDLLVPVTKDLEPPSALFSHFVRATSIFASFPFPRTTAT